MERQPTRPPDWALHLFDRYCQLEMEARVRWMNTGERTRDDVHDESRRIADFRNRRVQDPRFGRFYNLKVLNSRPTRKHLDVLTDLVVRSVATGKPIDLADLFVPKRRDGEGGEGEWDGAAEFHDYAPRRFQQLRNEVYPSFVYDDANGGKPDNSKAFRTVATPGPLPSTPFTAEANHHLSADAQEAKRHIVPIDRYATTIALDGDRLRRQSIWNEMLRRLASPWLKDLKGVGAPLPDLRLLVEDEWTRGTVFNHLESIVISEWFRGRTVERQNEILRSRPPPTLSKEDVEYAWAALGDRSWSLDQRGWALFEVASAWLHLGFPEETEVIGRMLTERMPEQHQLGAMAQDTVAVSLLHQGRPEDASPIWARLAERWAGMGDNYQSLIATKNLARSHLAADDRAGYDAAVKLYLEGMLALPSERRFSAALNLAGLLAQSGDIRGATRTISEATDFAGDDQLDLITMLLGWLGERSQGMPVSANEWMAGLQRCADLRNRHR